jgi:hypothetical protein
MCLAQCRWWFLLMKLCPVQPCWKYSTLRLIPLAYELAFGLWWFWIPALLQLRASSLLPPLFLQPLLSSAGLRFRAAAPPAAFGFPVSQYPEDPVWLLAIAG